MITDFARGRLEGEIILISPTDSAGKPSPGSRQEARLWARHGQLPPPRVGSKGSSSPRNDGLWGRRWGQAICWDMTGVSLQTHVPGMSLSLLGIAQPKLLTPQRGDCGVWAGGALHQPHVGLAPDTGIKDSPGMALCHSNPPSSLDAVRQMKTLPTFSKWDTSKHLLDTDSQWSEEIKMKIKFKNRGV